MTGLLLAGGASRRFGRDKASFPVGGRPMIARVHDAVRPFVADVLVSVRPGGGVPEVEARPVVDRYPGAGPLAGLHAGLSESRTEWLLAVACDMPFLTRAVVRALLAAPRALAVAARTPDGRVQPLCALYHASLAPLAARALDAGELRLFTFLDQVPDRLFVDVPSRPLRNVNRPEDLIGASCGGAR